MSSTIWHLDILVHRLYYARYTDYLQTADLAAAPITINQQRKEVIDFSKPFMSFGTTILMKRPEEGEELPINVSTKKTARLLHY